MNDVWPSSALDPVARLRVLAAGLKGAVLVESTIPAPFDVVWDVVTDLERTVPMIQPRVRRAAVLVEDDARLMLHVECCLGLRSRMDVVCRPGWCLMQSRHLQVGTAAVARGDHTAVARFVALRQSVNTVTTVLRPWTQSSLKAQLHRLGAIAVRER